MDIYRSKIGFAPLVFFTAALWTLFFVVTVKASQQADISQKQEAAAVVKSDHAQAEKPKPLAIVPDTSGLVSTESCSSCDATDNKTNGTQPHLDLRQSIIADIPLLFTTNSLLPHRLQKTRVIMKKLINLTILKKISRTLLLLPHIA